MAKQLLMFKDMLFSKPFFVLCKNESFKHLKKGCTVRGCEVLFFGEVYQVTVAGSSLSCLFLI
jgi:hypothetical protein